LREGKEQEAEAARQPACAIVSEIVNMMGQCLELAEELSLRCPDEALHYLAESAELAMGAARCARMYIIDTFSYCSDETQRYIRRRENDLMLEQFAPMAEKIIARAEEAIERRAK